jgi:hypothetical protein
LVSAGPSELVVCGVQFIVMFMYHERVRNVNVGEETDLVGRVVAALRESTGLASRVVSWGPGVDVEIANLSLRVVMKRRIDRAATVAVISSRIAEEGRQDSGQAVLVATEYLSTAVLQACRSLGVNAADASGNVCLAWDGLVVFVSGRPRLSRPSERLGWTAAAVHVGLLALVDPQLLNGSYRAISKSADVSLGSVGSALEWLHERGYVSTSKTERVVKRPADLLDEWTVAYSARLRPRLNSQRFAWPMVPPKWWRTADVAPACWSGEVGAAVLQRELRPVGATLYVAATSRVDMVRRLVKQYRLVPDLNGSVEILDQFWNLEGNSKKSVAPWPLVYADLVRGTDPRLFDAAAAIRDENL